LTSRAGGPTQRFTELASAARLLGGYTVELTEDVASGAANKGAEIRMARGCRISHAFL